MMFARPALYAFLVLSLAACASQRVSVATRQLSEADFASYETFSFMPGRALLVASTDPVRPLLESRLKDASTRALTARGFRAASNPEAADFVLSFTLGARDKIKETSYPITYRESWQVGSPHTATMEVRNYTEGTLSIDIFEVKSRQPVWHGRATKTLTPADRGNEALVKKVVGAILMEFPPA